MKPTNSKLNLVCAASLSIVAGCTTSPSARALSANKSAIYTWQSDANGFNTRSFFYDNGEEVIAFDTQFTPEAAKKSIEFLRSKTQNPITYVVLTHPNPDKFNGMGVFQAQGAKVIASKKTASALEGVHAYKKYFFVNIAKSFTEESYPKLSNIDETFENRFDLRLQNGEIIELTESGIPGVSSNQTVAYIPNMKALFVGDLVHHKAHAWLEGSIVNGKPRVTIHSWIQNLEALAKSFDATTQVYAGRGQTVELKTAIEEQIRYLKQADTLVSQYVKKLGINVGELNTDKASAHYAAITSLFEKSFPGYQLSYMIQYGVYGLAQSKLK